MKLLSIAILALALAIATAGTAYSSLTMSESAQIAKIQNMQAKFHCLATHSHPMYDHVKDTVVPLSLYAVVRNALDDQSVVLPYGTTGTDVRIRVHNYTQRQGGTGYLVGYVVDKACFILPPPR